MIYSHIYVYILLKYETKMMANFLFGHSSSKLLFREIERTHLSIGNILFLSLVLLYSIFLGYLIDGHDQIIMRTQITYLRIKQEINCVQFVVAKFIIGFDFNLIRSSKCYCKHTLHFNEIFNHLLCIIYVSQCIHNKIDVRDRKLKPLANTVQTIS